LILGALKNNGCLTAFYYRTLIIEDWIEPALTPAPQKAADTPNSGTPNNATAQKPEQSVVVGTHAASQVPANCCDK
jgi:hypothetical protein